MPGAQLGCKLLFFHTGGTRREGDGGEERGRPTDLTFWAFEKQYTATQEPQRISRPLDQVESTKRKLVVEIIKASLILQGGAPGEGEGGEGQASGSHFLTLSEHFSQELEMCWAAWAFSLKTTYNLTYGASGSPSHFTGVRPQDVQVFTETGGSRPAGPSVAISEALPSATQAQKFLMSLVLVS